MNFFEWLVFSRIGAKVQSQSIVEKKQRKGGNNTKSYTEEYVLCFIPRLKSLTGPTS